MKGERHFTNMDNPISPVHIIDDDAEDERALCGHKPGPDACFTKLHAGRRWCRTCGHEYHNRGWGKQPVN